MSPKVLVADSDVNLQTLLNALLSRIDCSTEFATDGLQTLQKLQESIYDAILLELLLPKVDGMQVLKRLDSERPDVLPRVIVLSVAQQSLLQKAKGYPVYAVVRKPFDVGELVQTVRSCTVFK